MAEGGGISLPGLTFMGAGVLFVYSGLNDPVGGPAGALRAILTGKTPTPGTQTRTATSGAGPSSSDTVAGAAGAVAGSVVGSAVIKVAQTYLGVPYVWAGASKRGIDCSGLVLVAYRDGAGINLPHLATAQMARGKRINRADIRPGDLVGWGVPGNYPHIALAMNQNQVIVAPQSGQNVQYQTLWEKKVPGFGYPDIVRIGA